MPHPHHLLTIFLVLALPLAAPAADLPTIPAPHFFHAEKIADRWFLIDPLDRATAPSNRNSNKGLVDIHYVPYAPLRDAMRSLNQ